MLPPTTLEPRGNLIERYIESLMCILDDVFRSVEQRANDLLELIAATQLKAETFSKVIVCVLDL